MTDRLVRWLRALERAGVTLIALDGARPDGPALIRAYAASVAVLGDAEGDGDADAEGDGDADAEGEGEG